MAGWKLAISQLCSQNFNLARQRTEMIPKESSTLPGTGKQSQISPARLVLNQRAICHGRHPYQPDSGKDFQADLPHGFIYLSACIKLSLQTQPPPDTARLRFTKLKIK